DLEAVVEHGLRLAIRAIQSLARALERVADTEDADYLRQVADAAEVLVGNVECAVQPLRRSLLSTGDLGNLRISARQQAERACVWHDIVEQRASGEGLKWLPPTAEEQEELRTYAAWIAAGKPNPTADEGENR